MKTRSQLQFWGAVRTLLCVSALAGLLGCAGSQPQAIIGVDDPSQPAETVADVKAHNIYVMTTRQPAGDSTIMYSGARADKLGLSRVTVTIPPNHSPGRVERPKRVPPDPKTEFTIVRPVTFENERDFVADINHAFRGRSPKDRTILVFVHGYNTNFTDAVLRMGQFVEDTGFTGVPVLFSWASAGKLLSYVYDLNSTLAARDDLIRASDILIRTGETELNIVAHSMGNFLTVEAMRQAQVQGRFNSSGTLKNIILASADIDVDVFKDQVSVFDPKDRRFYVLISEDDKALSTSRWLARGVNRVGDADAETLAALGVTVIDMSKVKDPNNLNHGKFSESPEVVQLIGGGILEGTTLATESTQPGIFGSALLGLANVEQTVEGGGGQIIVLPGE